MHQPCVHEYTVHAVLRDRLAFLMVPVVGRVRARTCGQLNGSTS